MTTRFRQVEGATEMLAAFVLMVFCAGAGMALTFWALRDNLRRTRRTQYRPRGRDSPGSDTSKKPTK